MSVCVCVVFLSAYVFFYVLWDCVCVRGIVCVCDWVIVCFACAFVCVCVWRCVWNCVWNCVCMFEYVCICVCLCVRSCL